MKKTVVLVVPLLLILALAITGCGKSSGGGNGGDSYATPDVTMGQTDFTHHSLTVTAGTEVKFITEQSGSTHILCIGENGACQSGAQGPSELTSANGLQVDPGQTKPVKFDTAGTYKVTCTIHPTMNMVITVQ